MSFELLAERVIDANLCISCGNCARNCKHIRMQEQKGEDNKPLPELKDKCILTSNGLACGNCYNNCPIVRRWKKKDPDNFLTTRERVLKLISQNLQITIPKLSHTLGLSMQSIRFEILRLVELKQVKVEISPNQRNPVFSIEAEA